MKVFAYCGECQHIHNIDFDPLKPDNQFSDWYVKHFGHENVGFDYPERMAEESELIMPGNINTYLHNANIKIAYGTQASFTCTIASLATDTNILAGRAGTSISNASNLYLDHLIAGLVTTGTSPTASKQIELWIIAGQDDTPTWPDSVTGSDANKTFTSRDVLGLCGALHSVVTTSSSSNVSYPFRMASLASMFGGSCPRDFLPFVVHNTGVNLNSTAGNHFVKALPVYATAI